MTTKSIQVSGMTCQHCVKSVTSALTEIAPGASVVVDLASGLVTLDGALLPADDQLKHAIESIGFDVQSS